MPSQFDTDFLAIASGMLDTVHGQSVTYTTAAGVATTGLTGIVHNEREDILDSQDGQFTERVCSWDMDLDTYSITPGEGATITDEHSTVWAIIAIDRGAGGRYLLQCRAIEARELSRAQFRIKR